MCCLSVITGKGAGTAPPKPRVDLAEKLKDVSLASLPSDLWPAASALADLAADANKSAFVCVDLAKFAPHWADVVATPASEEDGTASTVRAELAKASASCISANCAMFLLLRIPFRRSTCHAPRNARRS